MRTICFLLWLMGLAVVGFADEIHLKDGTRLKGTILKEDDQELQVEVALAGGTIFKTETIKRAQIDVIVRQTDAEKAAEEMEQAFKRLSNYRLNPQASQPAKYYEEVIQNVFKRLLHDYPGSPHETDVKERLATWEAERERVARGEAKYNGQWLSASEVASKREELQLNATFVRACDLVSRYEYQAGIELFRTALKEGPGWDQLQAWTDTLTKQQTAAGAAIKQREGQLVTLRQRQQQAAHPAPSQFKGASSFGSSAGAVTLAAQATRAAEKELADSQAQLAAINTMLEDVRRQTTRQVQPVASTAPATPATSAPQSSGEFLDQVGEQFRRYWVWGIIALAIGVWLFKRYV